MLKILLAAAVLLTSACTLKKEDEDLKGTVLVQVPFVIDGRYDLHILELLTLKNLPQLSGGAAKFLMDPDSVSGVLTGRAPNLKYMRSSSGVVIPTDDMSLQLLTVYAHFERLQILDEKVGAKGILSYPRVIAVDTQVKKSDGSLEKDNALYSGKLDAMLMVPFTQDTLPIMANGGVLAHEHFHALFQKLVIDPLKDKYPEIDFQSDEKAKYMATLLRGFNEGFADVWGWIYSGDTDFVRRSLKIETERDLEPKDGIHESVMSSARVADLVQKQDNPQALVSLAYYVGTDIARVLRTFTVFYAERKEISEKEGRVLVGGYLLKSLSQLKLRLENLQEDETLTPMDALEIFTSQVPDLRQAECNYIYKRSSAADKSKAFAELCKKLK